MAVGSPPLPLAVTVAGPTAVSAGTLTVTLAAPLTSVTTVARVVAPSEMVTVSNWS